MGCRDEGQCEPQPLSPAPALASRRVRAGRRLALRAEVRELVDVVRGHAQLLEVASPLVGPEPLLRLLGERSEPQVRSVAQEPGIQKVRDLVLALAQRRDRDLVGPADHRGGKLAFSLPIDGAHRMSRRPASGASSRALRGGAPSATT